MHDLITFFLVQLYRLAVLGFSIFICLLQFYDGIIIETDIHSGDFPRKFDFIVVGGGSAGAIVAARLSEDPHVNVLLLEAGVQSTALLKIPALATLHLQSNLDWSYKTVPQKHSCFGLKNKTSLWHAGKVLGGSTNLNYMLYVRGTKEDYESYSEWSWNEISYYFKKSLKQERGSLPIRDSIYSTQLSHCVLKATEELGHSVHDVNEGDGTGFSKPVLNLNNNGHRWTADQALRERPNLKILTNAHVEKILFSGEKRAKAVKTQYKGNTEIFSATNEIIVSAGTVGSAKLLLLSGVGPSKHLRSKKVKEVVDLPVGLNLQDHVVTGLDLVLLNTSVFHIMELINPKSIFQYFWNGVGPFTSSMCEGIGVIKTDVTSDVPDLEFMIMIAGLASDYGVFMRHALGLSDHLWDNYFKELVGKPVATILPVLLHPKSVGRIKLASKDPHAMPLIDPNYLSDGDDIVTLIKGIRFIQQLVKTDAMKEIGATFNNKILPGCEMYTFDSDQYWQCYVRHLTLTAYHPVGTCRIGKENSVVDFKLKVYGTENLRVIDASVLPTLPSGNTNAAVVMVAEKGADMIKESYYTSQRSCLKMDAFILPRMCLFVPFVSSSSSVISTDKFLLKYVFVFSVLWYLLDLDL